MSEPTAYDLVQDTRIKGVEDLVQTTYTPFQGPEFSYPVVHQPMDDEMWQYVTLGVGSGLLDVGGRPYWLRDLSDVTDTGKLTVSTTTKTAQAILRGFYHRLNQDMTLSFPAVSRKTVYQVALEYDPLRHKEPGGPIRVRVLTSLDRSGGKHYLPLWDLERDPSQLLSKAKVTQRRPKISPTIHVDYIEGRPEPHTQLWGAQCYIRYGDHAGETFIASGESEETGGPTDWIPMPSPAWKNIDLRSEYTSGWRNTPQYRVKDGYVELRGIINRKDGGDLTRGSRVQQFGWIRGLDMSPFRSFPVAASGGLPCRVDTMDGTPTHNDLGYYTEATIKWFCLDGIRFPVKGWVS